MRGPRSVVHGFSDFLTSVRGPRLLETTIQVVLTALPRGADSMPTSRQASRSAPADLRPVRFPWIARSDGNEPDTIGPRRCAGRPRDQRLCPQTEATGGRAPATPHGLVGYAVPARANASKTCRNAPRRVRQLGPLKGGKLGATVCQRSEP